ncbi:hypothetical protein C8Q80DRAFT_1352615, partial [Daedaleopsis nitida]
IHPANSSSLEGLYKYPLPKSLPGHYPTLSGPPSDAPDVGLRHTRPFPWLPRWRLLPPSRRSAHSPNLSSPFRHARRHSGTPARSHRFPAGASSHRFPAGASSHRFPAGASSHRFPAGASSPLSPLPPSRRSARRPYHPHVLL